MESMSDLPDKLGWEVFIVGRSGSPKWAVLMCPCQCGERLNVNLLSSADPHWRLSMKWGKASLWPSLWVSPDKCGSHFWMTDNKVLGC